MNFTRKQILNNVMRKSKNIIDLGCGNNSIAQHLIYGTKTGVDLFKPYIKQSKKKAIHSIYIKKDIRKIDLKNYDAVLFCGVIEHLTKDEGIKILKKIKNKTSIISTTNGFIKEMAYDNNKLQVHKCGWKTSELKKYGYKVRGFGLKGTRDYQAVPYNLFLYIIDRLLQPVVYFIPSMSFELFAWRKKNV